MIKEKDIESLRLGHRARLRKKFLDDQLNETEILELLLAYAIPRRDVRPLARRLFNKYKSVQRLLSLPIEELTQNDGIKENTAVFLKVIHKLLEFNYREEFGTAPVFYKFEKLENYCKLLLGGKPVEEFHVFYLDSQYMLIKDEKHSTGTTDWTAVYTREIAKKALDLNAHNVVLLHNHPVSKLAFSKADIEITQELEFVLNKLNINLYDHLLVAGNVIYSMRNMSLLNKISE